MTKDSDKNDSTCERNPAEAKQLQSSSNKDDGDERPSVSNPIDIVTTQGNPKQRAHISDPSPEASSFVDPSGQPIPLDKIIKTANTMSSMMMAHKIALEDDFKLEPGMDITGPLMSLSPIIGSSPPRGPSNDSIASEPSLQTRVKEMVHEAYWDVLREELKSHEEEERKYDHSKQILYDIKQKMLDLLLPQHTRFRQSILDKFDQKIIDQLCSINSLDLMEYATYILGILSKLCAPVRDDKIKELSESSDIVQVYRGIMELLEMMRLDFANFTINRFKPHIKAHSHEYEREKFNEILKQQKSIGIDGLEYTKVWLSRAVDKVDEIHGIFDLVDELDNPDHDKGELNSDMMTSSADIAPKASLSLEEKIIRSDVVNKVLNAGYCELLEWTQDKQVLYPESLVFDEATFKQLSNQYKILVLTSSILLTTFAFVNRFNLHDDNEFKALLRSHVITLLTASYDTTSAGVRDNSSPAPNVDETLDQIKLDTIATKLLDDIKQRIDESHRGSLDVQKDLFKRQVLDLQNRSNRVRELSRRRILEFCETLLTLDVQHQQRKFASKFPPPVKIPLGLNCLADEITLTMAQLVKIVRYNRKVFFHHYQDIIVDLIKQKS